MDEHAAPTRPRFDDLPTTEAGARHSAWGVWEQMMRWWTINLLTPERVAAAARLARDGKRFPLNWEMELPDPPLFGREKTQHELKRRRGVVHDDVYREFNPQSSSHWDGLTHYGNVACDCFYGGIMREQITGQPGTRNGIQAWGRRGIAGRGVLLDYRRWAIANGVSYSPGESHRITADELRAVAEAQGVQCQEGDILVVRSGWIEWYLGLDRAGREACATPPFAGVGVTQGDETLRFLWDTGFAAVVGDAIAFETFPGHPEHGFMHETILASGGCRSAEMFFLEALADDCAADGRYGLLLRRRPVQ